MIRTLFLIAGVLQILIAAANFILPGKLRYAENLSRVDPIIRQIFIVHSVYVVAVVLSLGAVCLAFPNDLRGESLPGRFLSGFLALFWTPRLFIQLFYYDNDVKTQNRTGHVAFTIILLYLSTLFSVAAFGGLS